MFTFVLSKFLFILLYNATINLRIERLYLIEYTTYKLSEIKIDVKNQYNFQIEKV